MTTPYQYLESGLDYIWLHSGFEIVPSPSGGQQIRIKDIEGLHKAIGDILITEKKDLAPKELRFLRQELLLSQANLAKLLNVTEQTVHRWETGKTDIPKPAESLVRMLYGERFSLTSDGTRVWDKLQQLADIENKLDGLKRVMGRKEPNGKWQLELDLAA